MGKGKKPVQMQQRTFIPKQPLIEGLQPITPQLLPGNMEELEQRHAAWLKQRGYSHISLEETAWLWQRSPEQIIQWEELLDEWGYYPQ